MSIFSSKKIPKGFLIVLLAILAFEFFNSYFDYYFYNLDAERGHLAGITIKTKNRIALSKESNFDILILGDSHTHFGIKPQIIKNQTGLSCFNFSLYSPQTFFGSYLLLKNYIESHDTKPKYVIIGHVPFTVFSKTKSSFSESGIVKLMDLREKNIWNFMEEFGVEQGVKFLLPSLKHQSRFRDFIKNPFSFRIPDKARIDSITMQIYRDKGFKKKKKGFITNKEVEYEKFFENQELNNFTASSFSKRYLINILTLAMKNKITPIYYIPALPPYVNKKLEKYMYMKQHDVFVDNLKKDYPDFIVMRSQQVLSVENAYLDIYHLSERGAVLLSNYVAQEINIINKSRQSGDN